MKKAGWFHKKKAIVLVMLILGLILVSNLPQTVKSSVTVTSNITSSGNIVTTPETLSFGYAAVGANKLALYHELDCIVARYPTSQNGTLTSISAYLSASSPQSVTLVIYSDNNGRPDALLAQAPTGSFQTAGWQTVSGLSVTIIAGSYYWLGVLGHYDSFQYYETGQASQSGDNGAYGGINNPYGAITLSNYKISIYANYTRTGRALASDIGFTNPFSSTSNTLHARFSSTLGSLTQWSYADNQTGTLVYRGPYSFNGDTWANATITNPQSGSIQWIINCSDSIGTKGTTGLQNFTVSPSSTLSLRAVDNRLITPNGSTVILKGVDYTYFMDTEGGSWMLPDGSIHWSSNPMDQNGVSKFLDFMQASNANGVRIFITIQFWQQNSNNYRSNIESFITQAANRGIYTVIVPWRCNSTGAEPIGSFPWEDHNGIINNINDFVNFWSGLSNELKNYPSVVFEIWNEPNSASANAESTWMSVNQLCINAIRNSATQPIMVAFNFGISYDFGSGYIQGEQWVFDYPLSDPLHNLIYTDHIYSNTYSGFYNSSSGTMVTDYTSIRSALTNCKVLAVAAKYPFYVGEIGDDRQGNIAQQDAYFNNTLTILNENGIGYAAFASPPWSDSTASFRWALVTANIPNYALNSAGRILVERLGGTDYATWLSSR